MTYQNGLVSFLAKTTVLLLTLTILALGWSLPSKANERDSVSCLKPITELTINPQTFDCKKDSDCQLVREACRSCQAPIAANKIHLKELLAADQKERLKDRCVIACEACDQTPIKVKCINRKCMGTR
jgi:hypothetical protein